MLFICDSFKITRFLITLFPSYFSLYGKLPLCMISTVLVPLQTLLSLHLLQISINSKAFKNVFIAIRMFSRISLSHSCGFLDITCIMKCLTERHLTFQTMFSLIIKCTFVYVIKALCFRF